MANDKYQKVADKIMKNIKRGVQEYGQDQDSYRDYLAAQIGYSDFNQMLRNRSEIAIHTLALFDILCEEKGFEAFFSPK